MAVSSLTGLFKTTSDAAGDHDKLVDLFRNRAELKKEFAMLRNEKYRLQDRIKHHEGNTARVQQKLEHVENLLSDPEWVHNVVAYYQLRRLARHCNDKLARFAEQIKQQHEKRIHTEAMAAWNEKRNDQVISIENEIGEQRLAVQLLEDRLQAERHRLLTMNGLSRFFRKRGLQAGIDQISDQIESGHAGEQAMLQSLEDVHNLEPPDYGGLDDATKRSINCMILSFAQQLYLHFAEDNLVELAKETNEKSVGVINYGSKFECDQLVERIEKRWSSMEEIANYADILQKRSKLITEHAVFRHSDDVVPTEASTATVYVIDANGVVMEQDINLIGENYFAIAKVLSR